MQRSLRICLSISYMPIATVTKLEVVVVATLSTTCRLKAVLQLLAVVCHGDIDICHGSTTATLQ